jgi:hypothetical protein
MNNEFKKQTIGNITRYVLESASGGGTSAGSVASVSTALGGVQRRPKDSIFAQEEKKKEAPKPRNFVAKNAKMGGAGQHKDKKKAEKQGDVKHKKPFAEGMDPFVADKLNKLLNLNPVDRASAYGSIRSYLKDNPELASQASKLASAYTMADVARQQYKTAQAKQMLTDLEPQHQAFIKQALGQEQGVAEGYEPPTYPHRSAAYHASLLRKKQERQAAADAKKKEQGVAEVTGDKPFDKMMTTIKQGTGKQKTADRKEQQKQTQQRARDAFGNMFGGGNPADQLKIREQGVAEEGYGNHPSQRVDPRTGKKYVPPKSPLGQGVAEAWSQKYKSSINCSHPKGFSQKAHCAGKKKHNESMMTMEAVCPDCGMCQTHGNISEIKKGAKDSNGFTRCWPGHHAAGTKKGKNGGQVRNCVPNEGVAEDHEIQMASSELQSAYINAKKLFDIVKQRSEEEGLDAWQQSKITKAADYLNSVLTAIRGEQTEDYGMNGYATYAGTNQGRGVAEDAYIESLAQQLAEKIPKNAPVKTYIDDFAKAAKTPNAKGHHQFKNKSPEKVRQMAIAASYGAKNPSKKK